MDFTQFLDKYGILTGLLIWIVYREFPGLVEWAKSRFTDTQEHKQELQSSAAKREELNTLIAMGSKTFTEEQLTTMTSESQTQLGEANEFIRKRVWAELDLANQNIQLLKEMTGKIPDDMYNKLRDDLRAIAENWKIAIIEYRNMTTKMTILINLIQEMNQDKKSDE